MLKNIRKITEKLKKKKIEITESEDSKINYVLESHLTKHQV